MISYFLFAAICWAACLAFYAALLRREKYFSLNRLYLMLTLLAGLVIPLLEWPQNLPAPADWLNEGILLPIITVSANQAPLAQSISLSSILPAIYWTGCVLMAIRFLRHCTQVYLLVRKGKSTRQEEYTLVESDRIGEPFSFMDYLFWNPVFDENPETARAIRAHELAHIRQGHSLDLLILEIIGIFFWWNPLWHAFGRELRNVHEYQADAAAIRETPPRNYGQLLLRQSLRPAAPALAHGLKTHSQLKNRIVMMTKPHSSRLAMAKYLFIAPLLVLLTIACAQGQKEQARETATAVQAAPVYEPVRVSSTTVMTFDPETMKEDVMIVNHSIYDAAERMPVFGACSGLEGEALSKCSQNNLVQYFGAHLRYPNEAKEANLEGTVVAQFVVDSQKGNITDVEILKSLSPECDKEVIRLLLNMPQWQPGAIDGKSVSVQLTLPVKFKL